MMKRTLLIAVAILMATLVNAQRYSTLGRDPMIPGGVSWQSAVDRGWEPFQLPADTYLKMRGAKGEWVDAYLPKGTAMAWCPDGSERILACGNVTNRVRVIQTRTRVEVKTVTETKYQQLPPKIVYRDREVPGPERIVERWRDNYLPMLVLGPQSQYVATLGAPTVNWPVLNGIPAYSIFRNSANGGWGLGFGGSGGNGYGGTGGTGGSSSSSSSSSSSAAASAAAAAAAGG